MRQTALLLLGLACQANAQSWCPPGATWTYGTDAFGYYGYQQYHYAGDTVLDGVTGQRIAGQGAMSFSDQPQVEHWSNWASFITSVSGDLISIWSPTEENWDTLFWMGAEPGDGWLRAPGLYGPCDPADSIVVVDTTHVVLDGLSLRQWTIEQHWGGWNTWQIAFTERIGWDFSFAPFPACLVVDGPVGLRCYHDDEISVNFTAYGCETLLGVEERIQTEIPIAFPNPGSDHFALTVSPAIHEVVLFDATGRCVLRERTSDQRPAISTAQLSPGLYYVRVDDGPPAKWIKE